MRYMLLIYDQEKDWGALPEEDRNVMMAEYRALSESLQKSGNYVSGSQLAPVSMATSVRVRKGKAQITDGPFADTREQLGGYYLVEAKDLDEAIAMAQRLPSARVGTIEVRPLV
jgi:hypothetical protein